MLDNYDFDDMDFQEVEALAKAVSASEPMVMTGSERIGKKTRKICRFSFDGAIITPIFNDVYTNKLELSAEKGIFKFTPQTNGTHVFRVNQIAKKHGKDRMFVSLPWPSSLVFSKSAAPAEYAVLNGSLFIKAPAVFMLDLGNIPTSGKVAMPPYARPKP